jgi:hypothetical protein
MAVRRDTPEQGPSGPSGGRNPWRHPIGPDGSGGPVSSGALVRRILGPVLEDEPCGVEGT